MANKKVITLPAHPEVDEEKFTGALVDMRNETTETHQRTVALARELGYVDELSIGALEDGIRFWQRRTVEACLELGKRLVLLKEASPHGQFGARLEMLGFSQRTAYRFMNAAVKTAKTGNLATLAKQVKQQSLFLELVAEDDDVIERIAQLDDVERMAPSELRKALRDAKAEMKAKDERLAVRAETITKLQEQVETIRTQTPDERVADLHRQFGKVTADTLGVVRGQLRSGLKVLAEDAGGATHSLVMAGAIAAMISELTALRDEFGLPDLAGQEVPEWIKAANDSGAGLEG